MNDHNDQELKQTLKNWAAREPLPAMGRARLLRAAVLPLRPDIRTRQTNFAEVPNSLFTCATVYIIDGRMSAFRLIS